MKITTEDRALLDNLRKLAETNNNDSIAVTFELPRTVTVNTTYRELHNSFTAMIEAYQRVMIKLDGDSRNNETVSELIKEIKDKPIGFFVLHATEVAVGFSYDDTLNAYRKILSTRKNITTIREKGGLRESIRLKKD
ncbi:hypothetical protein ACH8KY_003173 [Salmonella enterica subsp. enterica serovar Braenderup]